MARARCTSSQGGARSFTMGASCIRPILRHYQKAQLSSPCKRHASSQVRVKNLLPDSQVRCTCAPARQQKGPGVATCAALVSAKALAAVAECTLPSLARALVRNQRSACESFCVVTSRMSGYLQAMATLLAPSLIRFCVQAYATRSTLSTCPQRPLSSLSSPSSCQAPAGSLGCILWASANKAHGLLRRACHCSRTIWAV